ncbi:TM45B protein, partial [Campylorhamphus procurvoides]|nr:TM45B protein [Campylorhamphus procurvoides]
EESVRMANFKGHALPGSFFLVFGLWWSVKYPLQYLSQRAKKKSHRIHSFQRMDVVEGGLKIFFALVGKVVFHLPRGHPQPHLLAWHVENWSDLFQLQHIMNIILSSGCVASVLPCPVATAGAGALSRTRVLAGCLFYYHVLHRPMLDQHIHSLLLISIFIGAGSVLLEVFLRDNIVLEMFRAGVTIVQGTWFWQIGIVLFQPWGGPMWDEEDHDNIMFLTMCFFWHWAAAVVVLAVNYTLTYWCLQRFWRSSGEPYLSLGLLQQKAEPSTQSSLLNGSDEE